MFFFVVRGRLRVYKWIDWLDDTTKSTDRQCSARFPVSIYIAVRRFTNLERIQQKKLVPFW